MIEHHEDYKLVQLAQDNAQDFSFLYEKYIDKIYKYIYYRVNHDKDLAYDLSTEVFTKALKNIQTYKDQGYPYSAYLYTITRNVLYDNYKQRQTINIEDITLKSNHDVTLNSQTDLSLLWERINQLKPPLPEIFALHYLEGLPYEEIAVIIKKKPGAIRTAISRTIQQLKQEYATI